jgi:hypothetical protein
MRAVVRDKNGKMIVQFDISMPFVKKMAKKLGLSYKQYMEGLAKYHVEEKRKKGKKRGHSKT